MPTPIEARYLSGVDIGKTFNVDPDEERTIRQIEQRKDGCWIRSSTKDGRQWKNLFAATETITLTAKPSPTTGPDCKANKHQACDGRALNETTDQITKCQCTCHQ